MIANQRANNFACRNRKSMMISLFGVLGLWAPSSGVRFLQATLVSEQNKESD
jgi:hypothetical protein